MNENKTPEQPPATKSRVLRYVGIGVAVVAVLVVCLPWIIAKTPLRNTIINAVIADPDLNSSAGSASFGWFTPLNIGELEVRSRDGHSESPPVSIDVAAIDTDRSWLQLWQALPDDAGTIHLTRPQMELILPDEWPEREANKEPATIPTTKIVVEDASIKVWGSKGGDKPAINLKGLNLTLERINNGTGGHLTIEPIKVFDRIALTPELCNSGLQLIAPMFSDAAKVQGEISFALNKFDVPLEWNEATKNNIHIEGTLNLHSVDMGLKDSPFSGAIKIGSALLNIKMPDYLRISEDSDIHFAVRDGRIYHEGFAFGLPGLNENLVIRTQGSVGLDESLDVAVTIPLPRRGLPGGDATTEPPTGAEPKTLTIQIRGTLGAPKIEFPDGTGALPKNLVDSVRKVIDVGEGDTDAILGTAIDIGGALLKRRAEKRAEEQRRAENGEATEDEEPSKRPILDRLRKVLEED